MGDETPNTGFLRRFLDRMTPDQQADFFRLAAETEEPCAVCGAVILCGGCPSRHAECPQYQDHKKVYKRKRF